MTEQICILLFRQTGKQAITLLSAGYSKKWLGKKVQRVKYVPERGCSRYKGQGYVWEKA
jgi:hypothetical protein